MDLQKLFDLQTEIENDISNITTIPEDEMGSHNVEELRFLALHIKIAELANLTKCYKYVHIKENIPKDKLTLRYVDAFQYLLSIGNRTGYHIIRYDALPNVAEKDVIKLFSILIDQTSQVKKYFFNDNFIQGIHEYTLLFAIMVNLGKALKIDFKDAEQILKNKRLTFTTLKFEEINL
ncbi:MAG: dUTP diphosphatase [Spirochaetaceae bacterium]